MITGDVEVRGPRKRILYLQRRAPYGTVYAQEGLEVALIGAAFGQDVAIAFVDDGVYQLKRNQDTTAAGGLKNFSPTFGALADFDVEAVYVERESMCARGLTEADLVVPVTVLDTVALGELIDRQDVLLNF